MRVYVETNTGFVNARHIVAIRPLTDQEHASVRGSGMNAAIDTVDGKTHFDDTAPHEILSSLEAEVV